MTGARTVPDSKGEKKEVRKDTKQPKRQRISGFKNALSGLLFLQNSQQGWRKLENIQEKEEAWEEMCTSLTDT